jgi:hypothetical protein
MWNKLSKNTILSTFIQGLSLGAKKAVAHISVAISGIAISGTEPLQPTLFELRTEIKPELM